MPKSRKLKPTDNPEDEQEQIVRYHLATDWGRWGGNLYKQLDRDTDNQVGLTVYADFNWRLGGGRNTQYARSSRPEASVELAKLACLEAALRHGVVLEPPPDIKRKNDTRGGYKLEDIGHHLNLSRERVRQHEASALKKMRALLESEGKDFDSLFLPKSAGCYYI